MTRLQTRFLLNLSTVRFFLIVCVLQTISMMAGAQAQSVDIEQTDDATVTSEIDAPDQSIQARIKGIFALLEPLAGIEVEVREGVVLLSGSVSNNAQAERAIELAQLIPGVVTVDDGIERRLDVQGNLSPILSELKADLKQWSRALPLALLSLLIFLIILFLGYSLARWSWLWQKMTPNAFLAELVAQAVRVVTVIVGLVFSFNLLGATALMATILGGAGVVGLAIGFAVRDTMENYISSIMLSLRQPFRANDHVVINEYEGKVVRLTSRATVLMTLNGNQLRIPNSIVFKGVILNYTMNPQRGFMFELGVDSDDDPIAAMKVGVDAMKALPFVLTEPAANAMISTVGDSNTVLMFTGWINQRDADFGRARSLAIRAATCALDEHGFSMPEPIYRVRFDPQQSQQSLINALPGQDSVEGMTLDSMKPDDHTSVQELLVEKTIDISPDTHIDGMVNEERALKNENDLLDRKRPIE